MCNGCWEEYGNPRLKTPLVLEAQPLIRAVYDWHLAGGNLHIVLDDWNLEDANLDFCEKQVRTPDPDVPPEQIEAETKCLAVFRKMSEDERASALALYEGFFQ